MSEYIVDEFILHKLVTSYMEKNLTFNSPLPPHSTERVVRCKDCKYCSKPINSNGFLWCNHPRITDQYESIEADWNGFCAWGEKRKDA